MEDMNGFPVKVCTYNLRLDTDWDGDKRFSCRRPLIRKVLQREAFDVIGFQEVLPAMRTWLNKTLASYTILGVGRGEDLEDEQNPVAFRTDKFRALCFDTFWLSPTPDQPGSRFPQDQSTCPRICTFVLLVQIGTKNRLRVYNTHLDHMGEKAREQGIAVVLRRILSDEKRYPGVPVLLMGDFNATPDCPFFSGVTSLSLPHPLVDVTAHLPVTFHGYHPEEGGKKIDYIFTNAPCDQMLTHPLTDRKGELTLSDHYPVSAILTL